MIGVSRLARNQHTPDGEPTELFMGRLSISNAPATRYAAWRAICSGLVVFGDKIDRFVRARGEIRSPLARPCTRLIRKVSPDFQRVRFIRTRLRKRTRDIPNRSGGPVIAETFRGLDDDQPPTPWFS